MTLSTALSAALLASVVTQAGRVPAATSIPSREQIEADLRVRLVWKEEAPRHRWWKASPAVEIVNQSAAREHRIVKTGVGLHAGLPERFFHATVERQSESGEWSTLPPPRVFRCGTGSHNWRPGVVDLAPNSSIELSWLEILPGWIVDARPHRIRAHYEFRGEWVRSYERTDRVPKGFGRMDDWPDFQLVSEPLELRFDPDEATPEEIARSLRLRLDGIVSPARWSDLRASVVLMNVSTERSFAFVAPDASEEAVPWDSSWTYTEPELAFEVQHPLDDQTWVPIHSAGKTMSRLTEPDWRRRIRRIEGGSDLALSPARALGRAPVLEPSTRQVRVRARYQYRALPRPTDADGKVRYPEALGAMANVPPFTLASDWIEVELVADEPR